jgi:uncharacterized membrane protein
LDQVLSIILILIFIVTALTASMINYLRYESSHRRKEDAHILNFMNILKYMKKGYAYSVDLGDSIVFIAVMEKNSELTRLRIEPRESVLSISKQSNT